MKRISKKISFAKIYSYIAQTSFFIIVSTLIKNIALYCINNGINVSNKLFGLMYIQNRGAAFSLLSSYTDILIVLSAIVLFILLFIVIKNSSKFSHNELTIFSILTAGIVGNLYERILDGFVTDYIKLNIVDFPIFNASDILITVGAVGLIFVVYSKK